MQQAQPLVSVIIPVYNSRKRLAACLDHVAAMDYPNLEVIIVDDCSTDGSLEICRTYELFMQTKRRLSRTFRNYFLPIFFTCRGINYTDVK